MAASPFLLLHAAAPESPDPTDAEYAAAARAALTRKDFRLAVGQASAAVALNPQHEPYLRLLDEVLARAPRPLELVAIPPEGAYYGLCAARARVLARLNRIADALDALLQVAAFRPSSPFLPWACAWVKPSKSARRVAPGALAQLDAEGDASSWAVAVERAAIHGERGELRARIDWLERAQAARPAEASTHLDLGDAHLDDGGLEAAIDAYERALELDASAHWATASLRYARALASGASVGETLLADGPDEGSAACDRARSLESDLAVYTTRLGDPIDPLVAVIRSVPVRAASAPPPLKLRFRVRAESPLAPSAHIAFAHALALCGRDGSLLVEHDGRAPRLGPLWTPAPTGAAPAAVRPPEDVLARVRALAQAPFAWDAWCAEAAALSSRCTAGSPAVFVSAMAHPPEPPSPEMDPVRWLHGFQIAAALLTALSPELIDARMESLCALLTGVDDWSAGAALLGLRALARARPELGPEITARARALLPDERAPLPPLARALAVLGCELTSGEARRDFLRLRARIRAELAIGVSPVRRAR